MKPYNEMSDSEKIDQLYAWIADIHTWVKPLYVQRLEYQRIQRQLEDHNAAQEKK